MLICIEWTENKFELQYFLKLCAVFAPILNRENSWELILTPKIPRSYRPLHEKAEILVMGDKTSRIHEESEVKYADGILCCFPWNLSICGALCNQHKFLSTVRLPANICRRRVTFDFELFRVSSMFCALNFQTQYNIVHLRFPACCLLTHGVICDIILTSLVWLCFSTWWFCK